VGETTAQLSSTTLALGADPATLYDRVPYPGAPAGDTDLSLKEQVFLRVFASDLPPRAPAPLWARQRPATVRVVNARTVAAAWQTIPSWYVIGTADTIITPESELVMAHRAHARILLVPGGSHLTLISHPEAVTTQNLAAAQATCSSSERPGGLGR
jgi:pimeloyl-ACP methyl ester carboxylesterase